MRELSEKKPDHKRQKKQSKIILEPGVNNVKIMKE